MHLRTDARRVQKALQLHAGTPSAHDGDNDVRVHVHELYLSVAGVVGLLDDGARAVGNLPLHTGRYVRVMLTTARDTLATLWLPAVPVFRVSARLAMQPGL